MGPNKIKLINFLLERNKTQSEIFCNEFLLREKYRAEHPTAFCALKCMDGRLNLPLITKTPPGIIQPFRNIGGKFDFGWPWFGALVREWVEASIEKHSDCVMFITYHFSKGDVHRGCAGFKYDVGASQRHTLELISQFEDAFGKDHQVVYPIQVGVETDEDSLILHGANGTILDLGKEAPLNEKEIMSKLRILFPDMIDAMIRDLVPLLLGNQKHIQEIRETHRPIAESVHREQILAIGRGFDWLHLPNKALIVGPYTFDLGEAIETAAKILLDNINSGRIKKEEGIVLITSSVYGDKVSLEYKQALAKTCAFANFALKVIAEKVPELMSYMNTEPLVGVTSRNTWEYTVIDLKLRKPINE